MTSLSETPTHWPWPISIAGLWKPNPLGGRSILNVEAFNAEKASRLPSIAAALAWRDAAVADGWDVRPTYQHEDVDSAFTLERAGWKVSGLARRGAENEPPLGGGEITVWAPDGLQIKVPIVYPGIAELDRMTRWCEHCGREDVHTRRVGFAGRVCDDCHPAVQAAVETPGWND